jgi:hypothetical protein
MTKALIDESQSDRTEATVDISDRSASSEQNSSVSASSLASAEGRRVRFVDESTNEGTSSAASSSSVVTSVWCPHTTPSQKHTLFYSRGDIRKFRNCTTLEIIVERAAAGTYSFPSSAKVAVGRGHKEEGRRKQIGDEEDVKDTPLLQRLLFDVRRIDDDETYGNDYGAGYNDDVVERYYMRHHRRLTLESRKSRKRREVRRRFCITYS